MVKILVLYHSIHGHVEQMALAEAEGAREVLGCEVDIKRVPETLSEEAMHKLGAKLAQRSPVARPGQLGDYDGIIFGTPTRYGNMSVQMRNFLDRTGELWMSGALIGRIGSVFTSSATQHGGQERTILAFHPTLLRLGMVIVGLPYIEQRKMGTEEVKGGSSYGASTIAGRQGERQPSMPELDMARSQGRHVASLAARLVGAANRS